MPMLSFEFAAATQIIFGAGRLQEIGRLAATLGKHAFVVTGRTPERAAGLLQKLAEKQITTATFPVAGEPTTALVRLGVEQARAAQCDFVIGFGGGSPLDTGKAIAALLTNGGDPLDYLEVIGKGQPLTKASAPYLAIPTTAGTGTEVTRNAVLASPEHRVKASLRSLGMLPRIALIDPELTYTLPPEVTASTGLDAFTQVLEPFVSVKANPFVDALCRDGLQRAARALRQAYLHGADAQARMDMALVSLYGGLALANAGLGAVHGFAGPAGGMFAAPHGALCARLLPYVMECNIRALQTRAPESDALCRYDEIARIVTGHPDATALDGVAWVQELCRTLQIPPLAHYGMRVTDIPALAANAAQASSMKGNPIALTPDEMQDILKQAL
jgi:alcohol dehydrogenase class IV